MRSAWAAAMAKQFNPQVFLISTTAIVNPDTMLKNADLGTLDGILVYQKFRTIRSWNFATLRQNVPWEYDSLFWEDMNRNTISGVSPSMVKHNSKMPPNLGTTVFGIAIVRNDSALAPPYTLRRGLPVAPPSANPTTGTSGQ